MAKEFNIQTYPTFFLLLLIMLIPFALSVDDIMNNWSKQYENNTFDFSIYNHHSCLWISKNSQKKNSHKWVGLTNYRKGRKYEDFMGGDIAHIFCSTPFLGLYLKITFTNQRDPLIIYFGKAVCGVSIFIVSDSHIGVFT